MTVQFTVPGKPVGKGRPKFVRATGRTYTPDKTVVYENWVRQCWKDGNFPKLEGPIQAVIYAYFPIPKSATKKRREEMLNGYVGYIGKPDCDNIAKCILDALNGMAYDDDSQVTHLSVIKEYDVDPGCVVNLEGNGGEESG